MIEGTVESPATAHRQNRQPGSPEQFLEAVQGLVSQLSAAAGSAAPDGGEPAGQLAGVVGLAGELVRRHQDLVARHNALETRLYEQSLQSAAHAAEARTDGLTRLANRRALDDQFPRLCSEAKVTGVPLTLLIVDVDRFKSFNDEYGHAAGDQVLRTMAAIMREVLREADILCRYGGEEFAAVLVGLPLDAAAQAVERFRRRLAEVDIPLEGQCVRVTASCGVAQLRDGEQACRLVERADAAMYAAKQAGRNAVFFHDGDVMRRFRATDQAAPDQRTAGAPLPATGDRRGGGEPPWAGALRRPSRLDLGKSWCDAATFFFCLQHRLVEMETEATPLGLVLLEPDGLESLAALLGHVAVELVCRTHTHRVDVLARRLDVLAQYGSYGVALLMPHATRETCQRLAERLRMEVQESIFWIRSRSLGYTLSGGVAHGQAGDTPRALFARAEAALREAQGSGGNRIVAP